MTQAHPSAPTSTLINSASPSELLAAVQIACRMADAFKTVNYGNSAEAAQAVGGLRESLRILLRALDVEPDPATRVAKLHGLCAADYASAAPRRKQSHRDDVHLIADASAAAVRRSVDARFPVIAAFLAAEGADQ